jgi:hypothetical protein
MRIGDLAGAHTQNPREPRVQLGKDHGVICMLNQPANLLSRLLFHVQRLYLIQESRRVAIVKVSKASSL